MFTRASRNIMRLPLQNQIAFAAFYLDLHTNAIGRIFYRETFDSNTLARLTETVNETDFKCNHAFVVTFENMPEYLVKKSRNSFQVVLATDGNVTYGLIYYYRVDSYERAYTGWADTICRKVHRFPPFTPGELESSSYEINPKILLMTEKTCDTRQSKCQVSMVTVLVFLQCPKQ